MGVFIPIHKPSSHWQVTGSHVRGAVIGWCLWQLLSGGRWLAEKQEGVRSTCWELCHPLDKRAGEWSMPSHSVCQHSWTHLTLTQHLWYFFRHLDTFDHWHLPLGLPFTFKMPKSFLIKKHGSPAALPCTKRAVTSQEDHIMQQVMQSGKCL
jgi:hypothetical protein